MGKSQQTYSKSEKEKKRLKKGRINKKRKRPENLPPRKGAEVFNLPMWTTTDS